MGKTKIEWCDITVNPVVGCTYGCEYCYARKLNQRFKWIEDFSRPVFRPEQLKKLYSKKPQIIFMNSMSDIADWKLEWKKEVFKAMYDNPQHEYLFLSKRPGAFSYIAPSWVGYSITKECEMNRIDYLFPLGDNRFVSIEPILEDVHPEKHQIGVPWVIVGAETGNRIGKVTPKREWIDKLVEHCKASGISIFMKDSLLPIMGEENMLREFPKGLRK